MCVINLCVKLNLMMSRQIGLSLMLVSVTAGKWNRCKPHGDETWQCSLVQDTTTDTVIPAQALSLKNFQLSDKT